MLTLVIAVNEIELSKLLDQVEIHLNSGLEVAKGQDLNDHVNWILINLKSRVPASHKEATLER